MSDPPDPLGRTLFESHDKDAVRVEPAPGQYVCDFCLEPDPTWEYPCGPVTVVSSVYDRSEDEFAACEECHRLIEAGEYPALVERMVREQRSRPLTAEWTNAPESVQRAGARVNVAAFVQGRRGPARPFKP